MTWDHVKELGALLRFFVKGKVYLFLLHNSSSIHSLIVESGNNINIL